MDTLSFEEIESTNPTYLLGSIGSGKSTAINALIGGNYLPTGPRHYPSTWVRHCDMDEDVMSVIVWRYSSGIFTKEKIHTVERIADKAIVTKKALGELFSHYKEENLLYEVRGNFPLLNRFSLMKIRGTVGTDEPCDILSLMSIKNVKYIFLFSDILHRFDHDTLSLYERVVPEIKSLTTYMNVRGIDIGSFILEGCDDSIEEFTKRKRSRTLKSLRKALGSIDESSLWLVNTIASLHPFPYEGFEDESNAERSIANTEMSRIREWASS